MRRWTSCLMHFCQFSRGLSAVRSPTTSRKREADGNDPKYCYSRKSSDRTRPVVFVSERLRADRRIQFALTGTGPGDHPERCGPADPRGPWKIAEHSLGPQKNPQVPRPPFCGGRGRICDRPPCGMQTAAADRNPRVQRPVEADRTFTSPHPSKNWGTFTSPVCPWLAPSLASPSFASDKKIFPLRLPTRSRDAAESEPVRLGN